MSPSRIPLILTTAWVVTFGIAACGDDTPPDGPEPSVSLSQSAKPSTESSSEPGTEATATATPTGEETGATDAPATEPTVSLELVLPQLSYAGPGAAEGTVDVSGFIPVIIEEDGTCSFALTSGGRTVTKASSGLADAASTTCGQVTIPSSELGAGTWSVTLKYTSDAYSGTSEPLELVIP